MAASVSVRPKSLNQPSDPAKGGCPSEPRTFTAMVIGVLSCGTQGVLIYEASSDVYEIYDARYPSPFSTGRRL